MYFPRCKMQLKNLNKLISDIDAYWTSKKKNFAEECVDKLFILTIDSAISNNFNLSYVRVCVIRTQSLWFNVKEFIKSHIKLRVPNYQRIEIIRSVTKNSIYINPHNGTAVAIGESKVLKFYFKDVDYFKSIHNKFAKIAGYEVDYKNGLLIITMPKYKKAKNGTIDNGSILLSTIPRLHMLHNAKNNNPTLLELLSPQKKISQLIEFYDQKGNTYCNRYIKLAKLVEEKASLYEETICHGDLWIENILMEDSGETMLIDYDKAVTFVPAYDFVYFFLMSNILPRKITVNQVCEQITHYTSKAEDYFLIDCKSSLGEFSTEEIKLSIYLFTLLKLTEKDLRNNKYGESWDLLKNQFSKL